jgi:hypothetical protein
MLGEEAAAGLKRYRAGIINIAMPRAEVARQIEANVAEAPFPSMASEVARRR